MGAVNLMYADGGGSARQSWDQAGTNVQQTRSAAPLSIKAHYNDALPFSKCGVWCLFFLVTLGGVGPTGTPLELDDVIDGVRLVT
jgi:hypothetical protein